MMVSEWMENGNINVFVKAHPNIERPELVCFSFKVLVSLDTDARVINLAYGCNRRVDLYA